MDKKEFLDYCNDFGNKLVDIKVEDTKYYNVELRLKKESDRIMIHLANGQTLKRFLENIKIIKRKKLKEPFNSLLKIDTEVIANVTIPNVITKDRKYFVHGKKFYNDMDVLMSTKEKIFKNA